jgi:MOSC domain-containing protein YiiM
MKGKIVSINISEKKGERKTPVQEAEIRENFGIVGDAHASSEWHRQVSLLAIESVRKMQDKGLAVNPGDFAENITTEGLDLLALPIGTRLKIGKGVIGEVSQIGKECHTRCAIYEQAGDCVMPKEGIFIRVLRGDAIKVGDEINVAFREPLDSVENRLE